MIAARKRAGLTQAQLAKKIGLTRLVVLSIEVGRRNPSFAAMVRWVDALGPYGTLQLFYPETPPAAVA